MERDPLNYEVFKQEAITRLRQKKPGVTAASLFKPLFKQFIEEALEAELDDHLDIDEREQGNRRNGKTQKTVKSSNGSFILQTPRDRDGTFEPQIVGKRQILISDEIEQKVLWLYSKGMSVRDITEQIEELYGCTLSPTTLSTITDRVLPLIDEWQQRPLDRLYCFAWLDAMMYRVRQDGKVITKAVYNIIGVNNCGVKEILGIYIADSEGAKFWMQVLDDLKRRGVEDILIASIDNLKGFAEAIELIFPRTDVQLCIIHQIRNSSKYISWKDLRAFMADLRTVYHASNKDIAEEHLDILEDRWGKKYPSVIASWRTNWERLSTYFRYPEAIRRVMYTTNIIEGFHRQVRKVTKTKGAFTSDKALLKLIFLTTMRMVEKWTNSIRNWTVIGSELQLLYGDRLMIDTNRISMR